MSELATIGMGQEKIDLIRRTICHSATDDELALFLHQCNRTGLDPIARQIYPVKRWDKQSRTEKLTVQVSIDGFRLVAQRSGQYAGQTPVQWADAGGKWHDVWLNDKPPSAARVGVLRRDFSEPCYAVAHWCEYVQTAKDGHPTFMWATKSALMLAKCAEALALRKAFPHELSGLYTSDEMAQAENESPAPAPQSVKPLGRAAGDRIRGALKDRDKTLDDLRDHLGRDELGDDPSKWPVETWEGVKAFFEGTPERSTEELAAQQLEQAEERHAQDAELIP